MGPPAPEGCVGQVWEGTSPRWAGAPPHKVPRRLGFGEGAPHLAWGASFPLFPPWPPPLDGIGAAAPLGVETLEGAHPLPLPYIYLRVLGLPTHEFHLSQAQPYLSYSSSPAVLGEALLDYHAPPSPPRRCAAAGWSLPQPLPLSLLDQGVGDVTGLYVC